MRQQLTVTAVVLTALVVVFVGAYALVRPMLGGGAVVASPAGTAGAPAAEDTASAETEAPAPVVAEPPAPTAPEMLAPISATFVESVPAAGNKVALTFDLCERADDVAGFDQALVDALITRQAPATFFMGGKWARSHPAEASFLAQHEYFEIGNHSWTHKDFAKVTDAEIHEEIELAQVAIWETTGRTPRVFRLPYGTYDQRALTIIGEHGMPAIQWSVVSGDPDRNVTASGIIRVVKQKASPGAIVIMHANGRGWNTAEALPTVIDDLRAAGYELVTVSELLQ